MSRCPGRVLEDGWKRATLHRESVGGRRAPPGRATKLATGRLPSFPNTTYNVTISSPHNIPPRLCLFAPDADQSLSQIDGADRARQTQPGVRALRPLASEASSGGTLLQLPPLGESTQRLG